MSPADGGGGGDVGGFDLAWRELGFDALLDDPSGVWFEGHDALRSSGAELLEG